VCIDGQASDQDAFNQLMRIVLHQQAIFAGAGLAFIRVDHDNAWLGRGARDEAPLETGRKSSAAAAAQAGGLHFLDNRLGRHFFRFEKRFKAVVLQINAERLGAFDSKVLTDDAGL